VAPNGVSSNKATSQIFTASTRFSWQRLNADDQQKRWRQRRWATTAFVCAPVVCRSAAGVSLGAAAWPEYDSARRRRRLCTSGFRMFHRTSMTAVALIAVLGLAACGSANLRPVAADEYQDFPARGGEQGKLFGNQGLTFGGGQADSGRVMGVNGYLWRGALDTLAFLPLASADPLGGVIITDWYQPPAGSGERFKATAYILGRQLRADGVKISLFRQVAQGGQWVDAPVSAATTSEIENKVLARARELRSQRAG